MKNDMKKFMFGILLIAFLSSMVYAAPKLSVSNHWVEIHQNAADTQEVSISVLGFWFV